MTETQARARGSRVIGFALLTAAALVAALALAAAAPAAKLGGKTTLAPQAETFDALAATGLSALQDRQGLVAAECVADVTEVDLIDKFDWTQ